MLQATLESFKKQIDEMSCEQLRTAILGLYIENQEIRNQLTEYQNASSAMTTQYQEMKSKLEYAERENRELKEQIVHISQVKLLREKALFGQSSERTDTLFEQMKEGENASADPLDDHAQSATEAAAPIDKKEERPVKSSWKKEFLSVDGKDNKRKKAAGKRQEDLKKLPQRVEFNFDVNELNRKYGAGNWRIAFWEVAKKVVVIKPNTYVDSVYTPVVSVGLEHVLERLPRANLFMPKTLASESLMADLIYGKYGLFLPLYRQEHDDNRYGFEISRRTMDRWIATACADYLKPVYDRFVEILSGYIYQQCDETPFLVINDGREGNPKSYIWAHRSSELLDGPAVIVYCYEKERAADHLRNFYKNLDHILYLTCDGYGGYPAFAKDFEGLVVICGCMMHLRRYFANALLVVPESPNMTPEQIAALPEVKALTLINKIYQMDEEMKEETAEKRLEGRQTTVCKAVDAFYDYIEALTPDQLALNGKLREAVEYATNQKTAIKQFLTDGNIPIDDGATERIIRPIAQGRRSFLFCFSPRGAEDLSICSTIIETARANEASPYYYLKFLFENMPSHLCDKSKDYLDSLMPWSEDYQRYEEAEKKKINDFISTPKCEFPKTPRKTRTDISQREVG